MTDQPAGDDADAIRFRVIREGLFAAYSTLCRRALRKKLVDKDIDAIEEAVVEGLREGFALEGGAADRAATEDALRELEGLLYAARIRQPVIPSNDD